MGNSGKTVPFVSQENKLHSHDITTFILNNIYFKNETAGRFSVSVTMVTVCFFDSLSADGLAFGYFLSLPF